MMSDTAPFPHRRKSAVMRRPNRIMEKGFVIPKVVKY